MTRLFLLIALAGCSSTTENNISPDMGMVDAAYEPGCEGGLVRVGDNCELVTNVLEVLLFRTENEPTAQVCSRTYFSANTGIDEAVVDESGGCRVIDVERYGPLNYDPAPRERGVSVSRGEESIQVDESEIFDSCIERRTLPDGFFAYDSTYLVAFGGNDVVPAFEASVALADNPGFTRTPLGTAGPVVFTWTPSPANEVVALLSAQNINIVCEAAASTGRLEVPASLVAMLPDPEPPREEPFSSIRLRNRQTILFDESDAAVTLTADVYQSDFTESP